MAKRNCVVLLTLFALAGATTAADYDFFDGARYPGAGRKQGVDLYKVTQAGGRHAKGYQRRVVKWWPRKGVDNIEVKEGMLLRTWTLRDRKMDPNACARGARLGEEELTRRLSSTQPRQFKAHLIGFRGLGNKYGNPFKQAVLPYTCPAVVLRMEDARKRCFTRGTFVEKDERYVVGVYREAMKRIQATLDNTKYQVDEGTKAVWPADTKIGEPGRLRIESKHFVWLSGSQEAPNEGSPWTSRAHRGFASLYREGAIVFAEDWWAYQEYAGALMPFWERSRQTKYRMTVCGTYMDGRSWIGGYAGGGYGASAIKHAGGGPWALGLAHEWGHGLPLQPKGGAGGETFADHCQLIADPSKIDKLKKGLNRPFLNCVHARYGGMLFCTVMEDDPNWGYAMLIALPHGGEPSFYHTLARVGEQRGLFENGIRGVGDMMGEFAARLAELDCEMQDMLHRYYICVKRTSLEAVDRDAGLYRVPWAEAPVTFSANVIRLVPDQDAKKITVDFRGLYDRNTYSDWRACIVAVDKHGKVRYSDLWNKGEMEMERRPGDRSFWLTVSAAPWALPTLPGELSYPCPYEVKLSGCRPGTPHVMPGDIDDYELTCLGPFRDRRLGRFCSIPHPGDTPVAEIMRKTMPPLRSKLDEFKKETDRLIEIGHVSPKHWWVKNRYLPNLTFLDFSIDSILDGMAGQRHPNGGGWVGGSTEVAETAYVAPDAMVLDGAKVLDHAAIEDYAVIRGPKTIVSGHAKVGGQAYVAGNVKIDGYTRVRDSIVYETDDSDPFVPTEVPHEQKPDGGLWANYECNRDEEVGIFEDWYRKEWLKRLHGHLHGQPAFVVDEGRRGFRFDGRTQYAEASPILADLAEITVSIALKWDGGKNQAIFDFGTSVDNRFVLSPAGSSGKLELAITRDGKTKRITADTALPKSKWTDCRVEIDGKKISLWLDGRKAVEQRSAFRPADVYPAGAAKRNFVASSRDGNVRFKGVIDYLRVWHRVHDDFSRAPKPIRNSPRRVTREYIEFCRMEYGANSAPVRRRTALLKQKMASMAETIAYYDYRGKIDGERGRRMGQIESKNPQVLTALKQEADKRKKELQKRKGELRAEFEKLPETIKKQAACKKLEDETRKIEAQRAEAVKALEAKHKADNKALIDANNKALAEAKEKQKRSESELRRLEESFKALPEIAKIEDADQRSGQLAKLKATDKQYLRWRNTRAKADDDLHDALRTEKTLKERFRSMVADDPGIRRLDGKISSGKELAKLRRPDSRPYVTERAAALARKAAEAEMARANAIKKSIAQHAPEHNWLRNLGWMARSPFYNYPYKRYLTDKASESVGIRSVGEDPGALESALRKQTKAEWHTRCDWDWRLSQERNGSIERLPLLRKWLRRVRGDGK